MYWATSWGEGRRAVAGKPFKRWLPPPDRWTSMSESVDAASAFLNGAHKLIGRRPMEQWSEAEHLGMHIVTRLQLCFQSGAPEEWIPLLRRALEVFDDTDGVTRRRYYAVRTIAEWGARWKLTEWQASNETRKRLLEQCARELAFHDEALALHDSLDDLAEKLAAFEASSAFRKGAKSAERIVAEIIFEYCNADGALGLTADPNLADEDAIDDIRAKLARDVDKFYLALNQAEK
jgi:hypothetical protein